MEIVREKKVMRAIVEEAKRSGLVVGLVPTMGYFHQGHLELMRRAAADCDVVVVSLFVNPTQFVPGEDFEEYPRDLERDCALARGAGVDYVFNPEVREMYPGGDRTHVEVEGLSDVMCGAARPGHFRGVATVVAKLFNIVPAQRAYFGQKDGQQLAVLRRMALDLDFDIEITGVPTVREEGGLAMSSRNAYLTDEQASRARCLSSALARASDLVESGERRAEAVARAVEEEVAASPGVDLEYVAICDKIFLQPLEELHGTVMVAVAARVGKARLIDNVIIEIEQGDAAD